MMNMESIRRHERGLTLVEILVAVAILAVVMTIALTIYDISRKSYKEGENKAEQQQAVRIAFDRLGADLRMTGYNYNPDGDKSRPDEQIEAAYDTAVVIRGDFDAEDATAAVTPETTLAGGAFMSVSTGNDEIVAYVLAKPDGSSTDTLTFDADVKDSPRDGAVETVSIPNVALVQNDPPYTLYRVTLNDHSTWGGSGFLNRTPLIENVYSMSFRYFNRSGVQVNSTFDLTSTGDDIGGSDTNALVAQRKTIDRYGIELVGLTRDPDMDYEDANDPYNATKAYRKFSLTSDITPRNIGMVGVKDILADVTPPSQPATPTLTPGHCGGLYMSWSDNPVNDQVAYYRINYGTASGAQNQSRTSSDNTYFLGGLTHGSTYYITIQAVDDAGNLSIPSGEANAATTDVNVPDAPTSLTATTDLNGAVDLNWDKVTENTASNPAGDPTAPMIRDLKGYRVYRNENGGFSSPHTKMIADESAVGNLTSPSYPDTEVVNCRSYNYWVTAVDTCGNVSAESNSATGNSTANIAPATPQNVQAFLAGENQIQLSWKEVVEDSQGAQIFIDTYKIYRTEPFNEDWMELGGLNFNLLDTVTFGQEYLDTVILPEGFTVAYKVSAIDDCGNESALSEAARPSCAFSGDVAFINPQNNEPVAGAVMIQVAVWGGSDQYLGVKLHFQHETENYSDEVTIESETPEQKSWMYRWIANPPGPYTITATVYNDVKCAKSESIHVSAGFDVGCCLSPPNPELDPVILTCEGSGTQKCAEVSYEIINNNCLTAVAVEGLEITWQDVTGNHPLLETVYFDGSPIWNPGGSQPLDTPASTAFSDPKPTIAVTRNSQNPVIVLYEYDDNMARKEGQDNFRNTLNTSYKFRLLDDLGEPTAITGVCGPSTGMFNNLIVEAP